LEEEEAIAFHRMQPAPGGATVLEIDGGSGEGGGQIVRTALSLSALTGIPFRVGNIRANRPKPGLRAQHLAAVRALAEVSGAFVEGASIGSRDLVFRPSALKAGSYRFDIGTAGAVSLVFQALLPPLLFAHGESHLLLTGGTHVPISPPFDFIKEVFIPLLAPLGARVACSVETYGFYPRGGGQMEAHIRPPSREPLDAPSFPDWKPLSPISGRSAVANLPLSIAERQRDSALSVLRRLNSRTNIELEDLPSPGRGTFIFLKTGDDACRAGFSAVGVRGKPAESVGSEAAEALLAHMLSDGCLEPHLSDQIVLYLALAEGSSTFTTTRITAHLLTNLDIISRFLDATILVRGGVGSPGRVSITGVGYKRP